MQSVPKQKLRKNGALFVNKNWATTNLLPNKLRLFTGLCE